MKSIKSILKFTAILLVMALISSSLPGRFLPDRFYIAQKVLAAETSVWTLSPVAIMDGNVMDGGDILKDGDIVIIKTTAAVNTEVSVPDDLFNESFPFRLPNDFTPLTGQMISPKLSSYFSVGGERPETVTSDSQKSDSGDLDNDILNAQEGSYEDSDNDISNTWEDAPEDSDNDISDIWEEDPEDSETEGMEIPTIENEPVRIQHALR